MTAHWDDTACKGPAAARRRPRALWIFDRAAVGVRKPVELGDEVIVPAGLADRLNWVALTKRFGDAGGAECNAGHLFGRAAAFLVESSWWIGCGMLRFRPCGIDLIAVGR